MFATILKGAPLGNKNAAGPHNMSGGKEAQPIDSSMKPYGGGAKGSEDRAARDARLMGLIERNLPPNKSIGADKSIRDRLVSATVEQKKIMSEYMNGFHKSLKNENERAYAVDRSNQMINGQKRESGMSAKYGMTKQRAMQYEMLVAKIFKAGRTKHEI